ncbi:MAG TPA: chemotaxis protein CheB [Usitatibacter sp.]|nr:chemotaxis protein CheB [Usitatibacter sp.]
MDPFAPLKFVAGVGASAGGLESLERFFRAIPVDCGVAFVVVQHLSADHKSLMEELIARFTRVPVSDARDGERLAPNHIYLLPPGKELEIRGDRFAIFDRDPERALAFPIDRFLTSLAEEHGPRAIAVILSGSGSDGSRGVRRINAQGGLVLVEDPQLAAFDGMPLAAIETGSVDAILGADGLARALADHVNDGEVPGGDDARAIEGIVSLLNERLGVDFNEYKRSTIFRRVLRRARMSAAPDLAQYARLLERDAEELTALHFDLLIGVTAFFRDAPWFRALETEIEAIVRNPIEPARELRIWVAGCATGEEAYSIAMLFDEAIRRAGSGRAFKVFATDVHPGALRTASAGVYAADRLREVDEARLERYFTQRLDGNYQVASELRHHLVFTQHDLLADTPFTNLDLVSCRNLLIYLGPQAQRRALASLSYGLRVGGILFLGSSESPGEMAPHFDVVNETGKVFRKRVHSRTMHRPDLAARVGRRAMALPDTSRSDNRLLPLYDALLDRFMPPAFLVSEQRLLLDSYNGAEKLLQLAPRRPSHDFLDLVPNAMRVPVAAALARVQREPGPVSYSSIGWPLPDGAMRHFVLTAERLVVRNAEPAYLLSLWEQKEGEGQPARGTGAEDGARLNDLEAELSQARHSLQSTVEELEASNEELQATNEELVASNEELQSVNEELHSVNEELHTVNAEHQLKIAELTELNRDISHLLESIDVATVYLDRDLKIRKYTPRASGIFGLVEHDVGRYLESFNHQLLYPTLMADVRSVRDGGPRVEKEVSSRDGHWYFVRLLPYRIGGDIQGVVVTLTDATALAAAKARARQLSSIVDSVGDAIIGLSLDGTILTWNDAATRLYGYAAIEIIGQDIRRLVPEREREAMGRLLEAVARGEDLINAPALRLAKGGEVLDIANTMSPVRDAMGSIVGIATIDRDVREQKSLERRIRESERRYEDLYNNAPDMYLSIDAPSGRILEFNETFLRMTGFSREDAQAMHALDLYPDESQDAARECLARIREARAVNDVALRVKRKGAPPIDVTLSATAIFDTAGNVVGSRWVMRDVSARRQAEMELAEAARMREQFLAMVSHELRSPLHAINAAFQIIDSPDADDKHRQRSQEVVRRQTRQMIRLVDDLLDVSRIIHGKLQLERLPVDVAEVTRAAADSMAPAFHAKGVILVTAGMELPLPMFGDASRLTQVLSNVLHNALRCTPEGRRVRLECRSDGGFAEIVVADEGRGIDPAELTNIFGMFHQSRQGLARTEGGLGLGLTIADRIVTSHGGTICATSEGIGKGAQFTIRLPLDARAAVAPRSQATMDGRLSIVVVEDQDDAREILQTLLQLEGHDIATARDGREGLAVILEKKPQIGLLDIGLPHMNGYDLAREIRRHLGHSIKLVAMSGYGQSDDVRRAEAAGFDRHLTKPVDPRRLAVALRDLRATDEPDAPAHTPGASTSAATDSSGMERASGAVEP